MNDTRPADKHRYQQIYETIRAAIRNGDWQPGDRLPTVADLAGRHGVTAATIRRALADLIAEGLVSSHVGRGTFVARPGIAPTAQPAGSSGPGSGIVAGSGNQTTLQATAASNPARERGATRTTARREDLNRTLSDIMATARKPGTIAFTRGIGDPDMIEKGILTRLTLSTLAKGEELFWDYGDPRGLPALRESIAQLYTEQGIRIGADQVLVTSGSQQALFLLAREAREAGMDAVCETPCYAGVTNAFESLGVAVHGLPRDCDGPGLAAAESLLAGQPALLYLCPFLHNPMGTNLAAGRQQAISQLLRRNRGLLVSDEIFRDLQADGPQTDSFLADPDLAGQVAVLGSLSKSFISGLRVGWIVADARRIQSLAQTKKVMDLGCPPLMQGIAAAFLDDPAGYRAHRSRVAAHYRTRRDIALEALEQAMPPGVGWTKPQGGFQLWVTLPEGLSSLDLYLRCLEQGVAFLPGPLQDPEGGYGNALRLCYGSLEGPEIREGVERIARCIRAWQDQGGSSARATGFGDF